MLPETDDKPNINPMIDPHSKEANIFVRVFRGDVSLVVTYWVWGGLIGGVLFKAIDALIAFNYTPIIVSTYGELLIQAFYWTWVAYTVFLWIAIWRSAGKYQGKGWGVVARAMVIFSIMAFVSRFALDFNQDPNDEAAVREEVRLMNQSLPTMIDESTRMDSVVYEANKLIYNHTIIDSLRDEYDLEFFVEIMIDNLVPSLCDDPDTRVFLVDGSEYTYSYVDKIGVEIASITISESDCE